MGWEPLPEDRRTTRRLDEVLERLHRTLGLARPDAVRTLQEGWPRLVGPTLASACALESLHDGRLVVAVQDPAVAEHLRWQAADLVVAANELCGGEVVTSVEARVRRPG